MSPCRWSRCAWFAFARRRGCHRGDVLHGGGTARPRRETHEGSAQTSSNLHAAPSAVCTYQQWRPQISKMFTVVLKGLLFFSPWRHLRLTFIFFNYKSHILRRSETLDVFQSYFPLHTALYILSLREWVQIDKYAKTMKESRVWSDEHFTPPLNNMLVA